MRDKKISQWRREMQRAGIDDPATLDELEGHLREEVERTMAAGATEEEALRGAMEKLGKPEVIREEFVKGLDPRVERLRRRLRGIVAGLFCATVLSWALSLNTLGSYDVYVFPGRFMRAWIGNLRFFTHSTVTPHYTYTYYVVGCGRVRAGLMIGKKGYDVWRMEYWQAVGCLLPLLAMLPWWRTGTIIRRIGYGLFILMCLLMLAMVVRVSIYPNWIPLFIWLQVPAYFAQGWWLWLRMRRRAGPRLATAELA